MSSYKPTQALLHLGLNRRSFLWGTTAIGAALLSSFPRKAFAEDETPKAGGTLVVGQYQEPTVFDPNYQYSWETYRLDKHIYESLIAENLSRPASEGAPELVPALAESWEVSRDAKVFTFKLRRGVKFHDGTDFNAQAVRFNVRRFTDPSFEFFDLRAKGSMSTIYANLAEIKALDEYTVQYVFSEPFPEFPRLLPQGNYVSGIFSPKALQTYGQSGLAENPTGTGPFKFVSRTRGEKTELARNDDYWGEKAYVGRIIFRPIQDDSTRLAAFQAGEIDILTRVPADAVDLLKGLGATVHESDNAGQVYLNWIFKNRFAQNKQLRQAIIHAIDRENITKILYKGYAKPSYNILNFSNTAYDPNQKDYAYDPEKARELIKAAGFGDGEVNFTIATDEANQPLVEWLQRDLGKVGITVRILSQEWLTYTTNLGNPDDDIALAIMEWGFITPFWLKVVYDYYIGFYGGKDYVSPEIATLIQAAVTEVDQAKAIETWRRANGLLQADAGIVPLIGFTHYFASGASIRGFNVPAQNFYDLRPVWIKQ